MARIGGIDVGTTGCKIVVYDEKGVLLDTFYKEYDAIRKKGRHEIDFNEVKQGVLSILQKATAKHRLTALGITSFGETFAMLDEQDNILAPSMLYTDPRGEEEREWLCSRLGAVRLTLLTGVKPHQMYSIYKMMWHKNNTPELFAKCKRVLLGEDYIVYLLTGKAQIDYSLAARTAAFDIEKMRWIPEVFSLAGIDPALMSTPVPAGTVAGPVREEIKCLLGIDYDITVVSGCHDQVAGMIGAGIFSTETAMDGTGTVECIPLLLKEKPTDMRLYEGGYAVVPYINGLYACYALSFTGGATLKWFRDTFAEHEKREAEAAGENVYARLDAMLSDEPSDLLVLPHFAGAATPYMDNDAKAAFIGITLETTKYDIYRALMEGTAYEMLLNFKALGGYADGLRSIRATGGGAASDIWLQIKADVLGKEILSLDCKEVGAAGAAMLAGASIGVFASLKEAVLRAVAVRKSFVPIAENAEKYASNYKRYARLYRAVKSLDGGED